MEHGSWLSRTLEGHRKPDTVSPTLKHQRKYSKSGAASLTSASSATHTTRPETRLATLERMLMMVCEKM